MSFDFASAQTTFDPQSIGVGARALGMGKAAVAVEDGNDAVFNNPAVLGEIDHFKFTSMSGNMLEDANYISLGGIYPLGQACAVGMGYVGAFVSGIDLRNAASILSRQANFGDSLMIASLGRKLTDNTSLGINLKYYSVSATEITDGNGSGWNLDLGLLHNDLGCLTLGVVGQNLIRSGRIRYQNGGSDELPLTIKIGSKVYLAGSGYGAALIAPFELIAAADLDIYWDSARTSGLHSGLEFSPSPALSVRAGIDQDLPTAGISLIVAGLGFHYAYHPYSEFAGNAAHFFSLTFDERGWPPEAPPDILLGKN